MLWRMKTTDTTEMEKIVYYLTYHHAVDAFCDIEAERIGRKKWILRFYTWDGTVYEFTVVDMKMYKGKGE